MTLQTQSPKPSAQLGYRFVKYTFFKMDPAWKNLSSDKKQESKSEFLSVLKSRGEKIQPSTYSLVGTRGDVDFLLWTLTDSLETLQELHSDLMKTVMGGSLT